MTITRAWVDSLPEGPNKEHYKYIVADYEKNDEWTIKYTKNIGVLLTSHPGNRPFLKASVETHKKLEYWLVLVYDNYLDPERKDMSYDLVMPARDVFDEIDTFLITHHQTWGGVLFPFFNLLKFGLQTMGGFEYVFCSNGDCILEKPENFPQIIDMLGDADIMGCGWETTPQGRGIFNTTSFIAKTKAAQAIMKHFQDHLIPLDIYEKYAEEMGNTEGRFARAIKDLGLKVVKVPVNPKSTQIHTPYGTWYDILGFRHIHAEYNYAWKHKLVPPEPKYLDKRYLGRKGTLIEEYYKTKNKKLLKEWQGIKK